MVLRNLRWLSAGVLAAVALLASPSRSSADTQILISETSLDGSVVFNSQTFSLASLPTAASPYSPAGGSFQNIAFSISTTSGDAAASNSLSTTVTEKASASFDPTHQLVVTVTDDNFHNLYPNSPAIVYNQPSTTSSNPINVTNSTAGQTFISTGAISSLASTGQTDSLTVSTSSSNSAYNQANISSLPEQFAITQTLIIRLSPSADTNPAGLTFTNSLSSSVTTAPVPAPAGLVLALAAVPVFGLRRAFRRNAAPANG